MTEPRDADIAIIGMSGAFPGAATIESLWTHTLAGRDCLSDLSPADLDRGGVTPEEANERGYVARAGILPDARCFDAAFFGYAPREAELLDPQHRVFLEHAVRALDDAGHAPSREDRVTGVYASCGFDAYLLQLLGRPDKTRSFDGFELLVLNDKDFLPTRVSYHLGLTGPSVAVQTACSSSLVAVHEACLALLAGSCELALAGGVSIRVPDYAGYVAREGSVLAPDGRCRPFDADANGSVPASGVGVVVLRLLTDALADGDHVHAVIRGSAVTNDGARRVGYTAPGVDGQRAVIRQALAAAEVGADTIGFVQTHGTGTSLGDPIEIAALSAEYARDGAQGCLLGAVKANIGHVDAASGIAGLVVTVRALSEGIAPPVAHFRRANPLAGLEGSPFEVPTAPTAWRGPGPRRAAVSSFGIGGTNAHVVLEQAPARQPAAEADGPVLLALSARSQTALDRMTRDLADAIGSVSPGDAAYTLDVGRHRHPLRRAVAYDGGAMPTEGRWVRSGRAGDGPPPVVFAFPGHGSQHPGMGAGLDRHEPAFRQAIDRCADGFRREMGLDLRRALAGELDLDDTRITQPALFAVGYAAARTWIERGVTPSAAIGHSIGEYAAACVCGVLDLEDAVTAVSARATLVAELAPGAMTSVSADPSALDLPDALTIASYNGPERTVVSGPEEAVADFERQLARAGTPFRRLRMSRAFHSAAVEPACGPLRDVMAGIRLSAPSIPIASNVTGRWLTGSEAVDPGYYARQLRAPVRFADGVATLGELGDPLFVEVGPGNALSSLIRSCGVPAERAIPSLRHASDAVDDRRFLLTASGALWASGVEHRIAAPARRVPLPSYAFDRVERWIDRVPRARADEAPPAEISLDPGLAPELRALGRLWCDELGVSSVSAEDGFFALGGTSLSATRMGARIRAELGRALPMRDLLGCETLREMAEAVARAPVDVPADRMTLRPDPAARYEPFPLTPLQEAYWLGRTAAFDLGGVPTHAYAELDVQDLDIERFVKAFDRLVVRHDMLRAVVLRDGTQVVRPPAGPIAIPVEDADEASLERTRQQMALSILDCERGPLYDVRLSRIDGGLVRLHFAIDYLIADHHSLELLLAELAVIYDDPHAPLPTLGVSFRDHAVAAHAYRSSPAWSRAFGYWAERAPTLAGPPDLPLRRGWDRITEPRLTRRRTVVPTETWSAFTARCRERGISRSFGVCATFAEVLSAWSSEPRFTVNLTYFDRSPDAPELNGVVGDFTSTLLLEFDLATERFSERIRAGWQRFVEDLDHSMVSGVEVLRECARIHRDPARAAMPIVFTSLMGLDPGADSAGDSPKLPGRVVYDASQTPQVLIDHQVRESPLGLEIAWDTLDEAFPPGVVDAMFTAFTGLLARLAADGAAWSEDRFSLTPATHEAAVDAVNDTAGPLPDALLHEPLFELAQRDPEPIAVIDDRGSLTRGEVVARARHVARALVDAGIEAGDTVAIAIDKGWEQVVAAFAVSAAGGVYVPIDPGSPPERIRLLLERCGAAYVLVGAQGEVPTELPRIRVDGDGWRRPNAAPRRQATDLAYVIFTSGTTGVPKGVMIDHRGAWNTCDDVNVRFAVGSADRVLAVSALTFDLSVYDLFGVLGAGGSLVMPRPGEARDPVALGRWLHEHGVTIWNSVPAILELVADHLERSGGRLPDTLRLVLLSGDWIPVALPDRLRALGARGLQVISLGGATEGSIWSILHPIEAVPADAVSIPYGRAMRNQTMRVLDRHGRVRPAWVPGTIHIGGVGVAQGYLGDPERTAERFWVEPGSGERRYDTGDLGRALPDGTIEFLGRTDGQVKLRGFRVELGEVEAALAGAPGVHQVVVACPDQRLVAYVVATPGGPVDPALLREHARRVLPDHLVPAVVLPIDAIPLGANGKVDRKRLPAPPPVVVVQRERVPPRTPTEAALVELANELLGDEIGVTDDLFEAGVTSLTLARLAVRVREHFDLDLPVRTLFEHPTIEALASRIVEQLIAEIGALSDEQVESLLEVS
ncbi:MAG: amino acid adenylation domain-containing protein [Myxococcota bacterium]